MMPLGDDNSERRDTPIIVYALIVLNILFFLLELAGGESFIVDWSFVPNRFRESPIANIPTIFTSMFMQEDGDILLAICSIYGYLVTM